MSWLELKVPPVVLVIIYASLMFAVANIFETLTFVLSVRLWLVGALALAGGLLAVAGVVSFRRAQTTLDPRQPDKSRALVQTGIYRFSRNPMYAGFALCLAAWAAHLSNLIGLVFLPLFVIYMNRFQIRPEERALHARFGKRFEHYSRAVPRWL